MTDASGKHYRMEMVLVTQGHPEATTSLDITDGKFACRVYSYGSHLRSGFPDFYPSCVYEPLQVD